MYKTTLVFIALASISSASAFESHALNAARAHKRAPPKSSSSTSGKSTNQDTPLNKLYPVSVHTDGALGWTVVPSAPGAVNMSDEMFNPRNIVHGVTHPYLTGPGGKPSMEATYPKGSFNFKHDPRGGIGFYAPGPSRVDWLTAKEVTLGYSMYFEEEFEWQLGGKLPGLYGGNDPDGSIGCSGGSRRTDCFSSRFMWRPEGEGELYTYLPDSTVTGYEVNTRVCNIPPYSECNPSYGASVGRGSFIFKSGHWNTVAQRVRLNDAGVDNGEIEVYANGISQIMVTGLKLGDETGLSRIRGIDMQTFFGGSNISYATPKTQHIWFADFSVAMTHTRGDTLKQSAPPPPIDLSQNIQSNKTVSASSSRVTLSATSTPKSSADRQSATAVHFVLITTLLLTLFAYLYL